MHGGTLRAPFLAAQERSVNYPRGGVPRRTVSSTIRAMDAIKRDVPYALALVVSLAGSVGSVWLSTGMGLRACPLCFYQRAAVILVGIVLLLGLLGAGLARSQVAWLCLPAAALGLGVAAFHVYLEASGTLECPKGLAGLGTAPTQSLAIFMLLVPLLVVSALRSEGSAAGRVALALALGLAGAWACIKSAPPLKPSPTKAYEANDLLVECRRPFKG